jgi:hypothetical protein
VKKGECNDCNHEPEDCLFCSDVTHNMFNPKEKSGRRNKNPTAIVCATEAGPPPDGWEPEEDNNA